MKRIYENTFVQGRELVKRFFAAAMIAAVLGIVCEQLGSPVAPYLLILTTVIMIATVYVMYKYCRCPHCGKHIMAGVFVATTCPSCRRSLITGKKQKKNG